MKININNASKVPIYQQIQNIILFAMERGSLSDGDKIPSIRELAATIEINQSTVAKAYTALETMGIIFNRKGMGFFTTAGAKKTASKRVTRYMAIKLKEIAGEANACGWSDEKFTRELKKHWNDTTADTVY